MDTTNRWATVQEAAEALRVSPSRLRQLQAQGHLKPGVHWVYTTGSKGGPVGWDVDAIADWQRELTVLLAAGERLKAAAIETYQEEEH